LAKNKKNDNIPEEELPVTPEGEVKEDKVEEKKEESKIDERDAKIASLEKDVQSEKDKYLRLAAEYDNFRKRTIKEREGLISDIRSDVLTKILPVYDNLERALNQETADEAYKKGVEMTMTQLKDILSKMGVTEIPAMGEKFNPDFHNAVMHVEDENVGEQIIVNEFAKGFKLGEKVIRFSMVVVAN